MGTRKYTRYSPEQRTEIFWSRIDRSGGDSACWIWTAGRDKDGYGLSNLFGSMRRVHRITWEFANGSIPDGLCVLHNCPDGDNPSCCNPAHLWLGTSGQNNTDRSRKGRSWDERGESNNQAKLTAVQVDEIRRLHTEGSMTQRAIARMFGVSFACICLIVNRKNWK